MQLLAFYLWALILVGVAFAFAALGWWLRGKHERELRHDWTPSSVEYRNVIGLRNYRVLRGGRT